MVFTTTPLSCTRTQYTAFTILVYLRISEKLNTLLNARDQYCYRYLFPRSGFLIIMCAHALVHCLH